MNTQNILKFYGSKLDVKLDHSEYYDYEISKVMGDYNTEVLDLTTPIIYTGLTINDSLYGASCSKTTIRLIEYDNSVNDSSYVYSGISFTFNYNPFVLNFGPTYQETILNNDVYTFVSMSGNTHYFRILGYNTNLYIDNRFSGYTENQIITGFTQNIVKCTNILSDLSCCPQPSKLGVKPWAYKFDTGRGSDNCDPIIKRRTEKGWTLDFIFNRQNLPWYGGGKFYYIGVRGDNDIENYADNNLSFGFTSDGRIKWQSYRYSGVCDPSLGYSESYYLDSGQTPKLCTTGLTKDFNVTIVFDRYIRYTDCNLENDGGWNDLIPDPNTSTSEELNREWAKERERRLGTLKIYLNGRPIYKKENWEEVIPSTRGVQPFIQSWGGGTGLMNSVHSGVCCFNIKSMKYYEEPLDFLHVRHNFISRLNQYDFFICGENCEDDVYTMEGGHIINQDDEILLSGDGAHILYRT